MEFTGERFMPGAPGASEEMRVEHLHRYVAARPLAKGKVVLDAACGEGYGSALLAESAARVHGVDVSAEAVAHARAAYPSEKLSFQEASIARLPFEPATFDLVVSFETIEHVDGPTQERFLEEVRRVLRPDGLLLISTPDKRTYTDEAGSHNEFHVKEFYRDEFRDFLASRFAHVEFFDQRYTLSSLIRNDAAASLRLISIDPRRARPPGKYIVAACAQVAHAVDLTSFIDDEYGFLKDKVRHIDNLSAMILELRAGLQLARDQLKLKDAHATNLEMMLAEIRPALEAALKENRLKVNHIENLKRFNVELRQEQSRLNHLISLKDTHIRNLEAMVEALSDEARAAAPAPVGESQG